MSMTTDTHFAEEQILAAARVLADRNADLCGVNREDNWMIYGDEFIEDARAALNAAVGAKDES